MATSNPLISVIILTYNQEKTIAQAIESVLNQNIEFPFEIIIGEDCSVDSTLEICKQYERKYPDIIRILHSESNKGVTDNYFDCVLNARGEYIADCAGDDYWTSPEHLSSKAKILKECSNVTIVHGDWNYINYDDTQSWQPVPKTGKFIYRSPLAKGKNLMIPFLSGAESPVPIIHLSTALYRKKVLLEEYNQDLTLFRNTNTNCEDVSTILALMSRGDVAFLPDKVLNYRVGHSSISSGENPHKTFNFYYGVLLLKLNWIAKFKLYDIINERSFINSVHFLVAQAFLSGDETKMLKILNTMKQNHIRLTKKGNIYRMLAQNRFFWNLALRFKH